MVKMLWRCAVFAVLWVMWLEWNECIFQNHSHDSAVLWDMVIFLASMQFVASRVVPDYSSTDVQCGGKHSCNFSLGGHLVPYESSLFNL